MSRRGAVPLVALLGLASLGALADPVAAQPAQTQRNRAAARFRQGQEFFKANDYDHAIVEYEAAYQLSREPAMIFNIALCHDRAKRPEQALAAFERYLELVSTGDLADEAREDVVRLTAVVDAIHARQAADAAEQAEQARRNQSARAAEAATRARVERERREAELRANEQRADALDRRGRYERWGGIAAGAVGAVALGVAAKYGLDARSAGDFITDHRGPWTDQILARDTEGRRAQNRVYVWSGVGGAALIGSGVLYLLGRRCNAEASQLRLEVAAAPAAASVAVSGRF